MPLISSSEINSGEIDLNVLEDAIATAAQNVIGEKKGVRVEVVPSLPQMLTSACYMSAEMQPCVVAFGRIVPVASFIIVGADAKLHGVLNVDTSWIIETIETAWREFFSNVSCKLGNWECDLSKLKSLPRGLNLRFVRFSVFCYRDGRPERSGYFDVLGKYFEHENPRV
jgi:hypothetical protein